MKKFRYPMTIKMQSRLCAEIVLGQGRLCADIVLGQCFSVGMTLLAKGHFIWLCLETFVVVRPGAVLLASSG